MLTGTARRSASALAAAAARAIGARAHSVSPASLTQPLEGLTLPPAAAPGPPPKTELATLGNGVKVAAEDTPVRIF